MEQLVLELPQAEKHNAMPDNVTLQDIYYKLGQMEASINAHLKQEDEQQRINTELHHKLDVLQKRLEELQLKMAWFVGAAASLGSVGTLAVNRLLGH